MTVRPQGPDSLQLPGLDGTNPLGYLAALGALVTSRAAGEAGVRLRWTRSRTWIPVLEGLSARDPNKLSEALATALRGKTVTSEAERRRVEAGRAYEDARTAVKKKMDEIKKRGLKGDERRAAIEVHVRPLEEALALKRGDWLQALRDAVPRPELALGKRIDCTEDEYRQHASAFRGDLDHASREPMDLLSAFGSDACLENAEKIQPTPFCFTRGGGHQDFLDTVRQLIANVSADRVRQTLFEPWSYRDPGLSMRWGPIEDKRYALTDVKPADEGASTVWMANLLAYRGLALFACAPTRRGLGTTAWTRLEEEQAFTWPIWEFSAAPDTIRSLLQLEELARPHPDSSSLRARGVAAVFRARRIRVPPTGSKYKWNFSPARAV